MVRIRMIAKCSKSDRSTAVRRGAILTAAAIMSWSVMISGAMAGAMAEKPVATVDYACADGKSIEAVYYSDKVDLTLNDGRSMILPQTISGSGIRYANADESFVFWSKGKTAFATEGDPNNPTYADCNQIGDQS